MHVCVWHVCDTFGIHVHVYVLRNGDPRWRIPHAVYLAGPTLISIYINLSLSRHKPLWSNKQGLYTCVCICVTICVTLCAYIMSVCLMYTLMMCSSHAFPHVAGHLTMTLRMWCENSPSVSHPIYNSQYCWLLMSLMFLLWNIIWVSIFRYLFFIDFHDRSLQEGPYHNRCPLVTPLSFACCLCKPWMIALSTRYIKGFPHRKHLATAKRWEYIPQSFNAWYHLQRRHHLLTSFSQKISVKRSNHPRIWKICWFINFENY